MSKARHTVAYGGQIPVLSMKEGGMFVFYSPVLDLSTCGPTFAAARRNFTEALKIFFEECLRHGTLDRALASYGWHKSSTRPTQWQPPVLIGHDSLPVPT